jgi:hypothetical protein
MGRPKTRIEGLPRFKEGERVMWKSGKNWHSGEVIFIGKTKKEIQEGLPKGYKLQYKGSETDDTKSKRQTSFTYLVAADSPLFKPGFTAHSIPEKHLQKESDSWNYKEQIIRRSNFEVEDLKELVIEVAKAIHKGKTKVPENIVKFYQKIEPVTLKKPIK